MTDERIVLIGASVDSYVEAAYRALLSGPLVVVDIGSDECDPFPFVPDRHAVSSIRSLDGVEIAELGLTINHLRSLLQLCIRLLGGVDAVVVAPRESLQLWLTSDAALRLLRRLDIAEVALIESRDGGWERARLALQRDRSDGVHVSAVRPGGVGRKQKQSRRPATTVLSQNGFGERMDERDYRKALAAARDLRQDSLTDVTWRPSAWVMHEGWLAVSDHPDATRTPLDDLIDAERTGEDDLRPDVQAVLVGLEADDFALVEVARTGSRLDAVRVSIEREGFFTPGRWESMGDLTVPSGRLRIGKHDRSYAGALVRVPQGSRWRLETYESNESGTIGLRLRRHDG